MTLKGFIERRTHLFSQRNVWLHHTLTF